MINLRPYKLITICILSIFILNSCVKDGFFKPGDARKNPPDPKLRVKKNLEEGRGFRLNDAEKVAREPASADNPIFLKLFILITPLFNCLIINNKQREIIIF